MKKIIALVCFVFAFVPAQKLFAQQFSIGASSATHIYLFNEAGNIHGAGAPGLSLDFEATFPVTEIFKVSAGASLTGAAGYHFGGDTALNLGEIYFDIPVRARIYIPLGGRTALNFFGGPVLSTNLVSIDAHAAGTTNNYETYPHLRRFDVMLGVGAGIDIIEHIRVALGFDYGLLDRNGDANAWCHRGQIKVGVQYIF